jgi:hypothetical protein
MLSRIPERKIDQIPDEDGAKRLADQMRASGIDALFVEVEHSSRKSLRFLQHFTFLKHLTVYGRARDVEAIAALTGLRELCFVRVTVSDFAFLAGLHGLRLFEMRFGGCKAFDLLAEARNLIGLGFLQVPTLKSLDFVTAMPRLQLLEVDSCKGIAALPDLSNNRDLRKFVLWTMNGLTSLEGVEKARHLEYLVVGEAKVLPPGEFHRVRQCPSLRKVLVGLALMNSARYRDACECVPEHLQMDGYYGTEYESFSYHGYERPAEPGAAPDRGGISSG